ncbi:MAG: NifB/NifX family molybdenum-iron cluster-binding protein [Candidatus Latescibacterota bacterium]|nr:MAG: NifB/NifX family molybdenum-iron cluster-binding protein [Candidatus Latescibacterota bacterium]
MMKICIPTMDSNGLESRTHGHFGSAPFFAVVDTDTGNVDIEANAGRRHRHGQCDPASHVDTLNVDAVVCHGMGKRALASLHRGNIDVLIASGETVGDILAEARGGTLQRLTVKEACGGHGGRHRGKCSSGDRS